MYDVGDTVKLSMVTSDAAGVAVDIDTVQVAITQPDGTTVTVAGDSVAHPATGNYAAEFIATQDGLHRYCWTGTGPAFAQPGTFTVWPALSLVSLDDVRASLNLKRADNDEELRGYIDAAIAAIETRVGPLAPRQVVAQVQFRPGHSAGHPVGVLPITPVLSLTSVVRPGVSTPVDTTNVTVTPDGLVYDGFGVLSGGSTVTYTAGRQSLPADLYRAVVEMTRHLWATQRGGASRSKETEPIAGSAYAFPYRVEQLIAPHALIGIG